MENAERVLARMEQLGAENVREMISSGRWPANYRALALEWLRNKDKDLERHEAHENASLGQALPPEQTDTPEDSSLTAATGDLTNEAQEHPFWGVLVFAMGVVALAVLWDAAMRHTAPQAKSSAILEKTAAVTRPAVVEQDERPPPPVRHPGYTDMTLRDFVLDEGKLIGRKVRVTGLYQQMEDITLLAASGDDSNPIDLDIAGLPRKERSALLDCPNRDCRFQVEGRVRKSRAGVMVRADNVQEIREK